MTNRNDRFAALIAAADERKRKLAVVPAPPSPAPDVAGVPTELDVQDVQASQDVPVDVQPRLDIHRDIQAVQDIRASQDVQRYVDVQDVRAPKSRHGRALLTSRQPMQRIERFDFWCHQHGYDKQDVIGAALDAVMDGKVQLDIQAIQDVRKSKLSRSPLLMINDREGNDIVNYYSEWTSNEAKEADLPSLDALRKLPLMAVKCGVCLSILRTKTRVNSLSYCVGAATEVAGGGVADLAEYLRYLEGKARKKIT